MQRLRFEISEQPEVLRRHVTSPQARLLEIATSVREAPPRAVVLAARGSSGHAAAYGRYLFEVRNRVLTAHATPSAFTVYERGPDLGGTLVIGVSQSGRGEDVLAVVQAGRSAGARTVAIVNDVHSPLAGAADWVIDCAAGPEVCVPATKSVAAQMMLLAQLSDAWPGEAEEDVASLGRVPEAVAQALTREGEARSLAGRLAHVAHLSIVGRGFVLPVAFELALKLEEMARIHASAYSSAEFLHGPVTLVGPAHRVLVLDAGGRGSAQALELARNVARRGAEAYLVRAGRFEGFRDAPALAHPCDVDEHHAPMVVLALGQLLALELAAARGLDPEHPPGLRKVTSTR